MRVDTIDPTQEEDSEAVDSEGRPKIPAVVVVDSRNMWGEARRQFGAGTRVSVEGLGAALSPYGFDVTHTYVGMATELGSKRPSGRLTEALEVNRGYARAVSQSPCGTVLPGRLVERNGEIEEKLVDVLCAIQIARSAHDIASRRTAARAIVVLSEDMDLIPAYRFAQDLAVPVFATACATVDTRRDSSWLLLTESSLRRLTIRPKGRLVGSELRGELAKWLTAGAPYRMQFTVVVHEAKSDRVRLAHNSGAIGYWYHPPVGSDVQRGAKHTLTVTGIEPCASDRDFPLLALSPTAQQWPPAGLIVGTVGRWTAPTRVLVTLSTGLTRTFSAAAGAYLPGDSVLVHEDRSRQQSAWRLVGQLSPLKATPGWTAPTLPRLAQCAAPGATPGARVRAQLLGDGGQVTVQPPGVDVAKAGDVYAVVPVGHLQQPDGSLMVATVAVSSVLPDAG